MKFLKASEQSRTVTRQTRGLTGLGGVSCAFMRFAAVAAIVVANDLPAHAQQTPVVSQQVIDKIGMFEVSRIQQYLADVVPPSVVIETQRLNGEAVDCIPFDQQLSVRRLRAAGIKVEREPKEQPDSSAIDVQDIKEDVGPRLARPCANGGIPIRRMSVEEIAEWGGLDQYLNKAPPATDLHEYGTVQWSGVTNWGACSLRTITTHLGAAVVGTLTADSCRPMAVSFSMARSRATAAQAEPNSRPSSS